MWQTYKKPLIATGAVVALIVAWFLIGFLVENGVINDGNKKQQELISRYNDTTNVLSDCLVKTRSSVGVAEANTKALDKVITDAVRGRYEAPTTAQPGAGNPLFSAMVEAYPNLEGLNRVFEDVMITINGCRSDFRDSQSELQNAVTRFNEWRTGSFWVREFGGDDYPDESLEITVAGKPVTGDDALKKMRELVVVQEAQEGRDTGKIENEDPFGNS